ncbi:hypothetical protein LDENG_00094090 [Lucifuga dentata]|nr:hypothetical protein LDENG_00094090 [Lucifuga dentata]
MTATCAGSSSCLSAKGLDISLAALKRQDPYINNIVDVASQVALYTYNNRTNEWEKTEVEGTLFIYTRLASPRHGFTIMNRLSMKNLTEPITKDLDFQLQDPFLLYRNARLVIHGIWFYDKEDCQRVAQRMKMLTQQEQALVQSQGGWLSPGRGGREDVNEGKEADIIQMLTKARSNFDKEKSSSEPKEIGGSSVLYGNPNLIKPIPVKPNTQDSDVAEPKSLSLAALFGSTPQHQPQQSPISPLDASGTGPSRVARPPVARTLTYDDPVTSKGAHTVVERAGVVAGMPASPAGGQQHQQNEPQHCPAIQKLMQGQRGVEVLQTVSESPENRLCDNKLLLEHHQHHHHHHQQQQQQHPPPPPPSSASSSTAPPCCSSHPPLQQPPLLPAQHLILDSGSYSQPQHSHPLFFSLPQPQPQHQPDSQSAGLVLSQVNNDQLLQSSRGGLISQMPGVVSPHELLQKLQLVEQEQNQASQDPPRLAPRFQGAASPQGLSSVFGSVPRQITAATGQNPALQFQVISPQRIPATVAPNLLLSPSAFTQARSSGGLSAVSQDRCPGPSALTKPPMQDQLHGVLSRSQFQATLLHLIQTDRSFLDTIYKAYVSRFASESSNNDKSSNTSQQFHTTDSILKQHMQDNFLPFVHKREEFSHRSLSFPSCFLPSSCTESSTRGGVLNRGCHQIVSVDCFYRNTSRDRASAKQLRKNKSLSLLKSWSFVPLCKDKVSYFKTKI